MSGVALTPLLPKGLYRIHPCHYDTGTEDTQGEKKPTCSEQRERGSAIKRLVRMDIDRPDKACTLSRVNLLPLEPQVKDERRETCLLLSNHNLPC